MSKKFRKVVKYDLKNFYDNWGFKYEIIENPSFLDIILLPFVLFFVSIIAIICYPYYLFLNIKAYRQVYFEELKQENENEKNKRTNKKVNRRKPN